MNDFNIYKDILFNVKLKDEIMIQDIDKMNLIVFYSLMALGDDDLIKDTLYYSKLFYYEDKLVILVDDLDNSDKDIFKSYNNLNLIIDDILSLQNINVLNEILSYIISKRGLYNVELSLDDIIYIKDYFQLIYELNNKNFNEMNMSNYYNKIDFEPYLIPYGRNSIF